MEDSTEGSGGATDSFVGVEPLSLISRMTESISGLTELCTGGSSALTKSGSVMHGPLCKGVEDRRCSLLACTMPSLPSAVIWLVDKDEAE